MCALQAAHDRLVLDQSDAQTELALAERAVKKPPPGRQPSEKKKDKARVESLKAKVEGLGASVGSTEEGLEWMSKASVKEEDQSSASVEAAKVLESSTVDTAKISELERMNASLTQLKTELKEQVAELQDELSEAQAAASKGGGKAGAGSGGGDRAAQLKAEKAAKAAEKRVKALEAKVGKVEDLLRLEKEKSLASAGDKVSHGLQLQSLWRTPHAAVSQHVFGRAAGREQGSRSAARQGDQGAGEEAG